MVFEVIFPHPPYELHKSRQAGLDEKTPGERGIDATQFFVSRLGIWSGAHNRHVSPQHIQQLGNFIQVVFPQYPAHKGNTRIIGDGPPLIIAVYHAPEFDQLKGLAVMSEPFLQEKDRPPGIDLNQTWYDKKQRGAEN
jgi:hypothetical protein